MIFALKVILAALVIAFASWLSGKKPELSGFIIALPIASIIAIAFSFLEHKNTENIDSGSCRNYHEQLSQIY